MKKCYYFVCGNYEKFKNLKISYFLEKTSVLCIIYRKFGSKDKKIFKKESIEILKILGLINNIEQNQKYDWRKHRSRI